MYVLLRTGLTTKLPSQRFSREPTLDWIVCGYEVEYVLCRVRLRQSFYKYSGYIGVHDSDNEVRVLSQ